jgi:hypothetical protein
MDLIQKWCSMAYGVLTLVRLMVLRILSTDLHSVDLDFWKQ